jgi:hypothetical protein
VIVTLLRLLSLLGRCRFMGGKIEGEHQPSRKKHEPEQQ